MSDATRTIVRIGYQHFLVKSEAAAVKLITAMAGSIAVRGKHVGSKEFFYPDEGRSGEISIETVRPEQILRSEPNVDSSIDVDEIRTRRGNGKGQLFLPP